MPELEAVVGARVPARSCSSRFDSSMSTAKDSWPARRSRCSARRPPTCPCRRSQWAGNPGTQRPDPRPCWSSATCRAAMWSTALLPASSRSVPGYGETLRINGRLSVGGDVVTLDVEEALLHCAKAIMRSELWTPRGAAGPCDGTAAPTVVPALLAESPFVVLVSTDVGGHADVSPKGDPPGLVHQIDPPRSPSWIDPGNRRTDTPPQPDGRPAHRAARRPQPGTSD